MKPKRTANLVEGKLRHKTWTEDSVPVKRLVADVAAIHFVTSASKTRTPAPRKQKPAIRHKPRKC